MINTTKSNVASLIQENNILREQLSPENKAYYEDLLVLVRTKAFFQDETVYEETLCSILLDLIDAQHAGIDAKTYLGQDIYQLSDDIFAETPKESFIKRLIFMMKLPAIFILMILVPVIINTIFSPLHIFKISIAYMIIVTLFNFLLIGLFLRLLSNSRKVLIFFKQSQWKVWVKLLMPSALIIGSYVLIAFLTHDTWVWTLQF